MLMLSLKALGSEWVLAFVEQIVLVNHARKRPSSVLGSIPCVLSGEFSFVLVMDGFHSL